MFARYASAISTGTFMTFALLYVMQLLISLQPGAESEVRPRNPVNFLRIDVPDAPAQTREEPIRKEDLTRTENPPPRTKYRGGLEPIFVSAGDPTPPAPANTPIMGAFGDGPLVSLVRVAPTYPMRATSMGLEGHVIVQFDVMANGQVTNIKIVESTNSVFDKAALKATERFRFKPRMVDGVAYQSYGIQNMFSFRLDES